MGISPFRGRAIISHRENDFTFESALAEIIDNSIQAESKNIKIRIRSDVPPGKMKPRPSVIAIGDDGTGMNRDLVQTCLVSGETNRYNSREGLGRFGVGMTDGSVSVCQMVEVYSREHAGRWHYACLDIESSDPEHDPEITDVVEKEVPNEYKDLVGDDGTLVVWSKIEVFGGAFP